MIDDLTKRARELAPVLAAAIDRLNDRIAEVESALRQLGLGVRARVALNESHALVFGKENHNWRLLIERTVGDVVEVAPLANSSRQLRIQAAALLTVLVAEMVHTAEAEIVRVTDAVDLARAFIDDIGRATQPPIGPNP